MQSSVLKAMKAELTRILHMLIKLKEIKEGSP